MNMSDNNKTSGFSIKENIATLFENLEKYLTTKTVVGEQLKIGDITLIPFISISFGLGGGGGDGQDEKGMGGNGGGAGAGARVSPTAVLVIKGDSVQMFPINKHAGMEKLLEMVPGIIDKIKTKDGDKCCSEE
jgi:uncharacterized spore protein YtfJ